MAGTWTSEHFSRFAGQIRRLTDQHRELEDEPLHLALSYDPGRDPRDVFLFEAIGQFAGGATNLDRDLFEVTFGSTSEFPLGDGERLHLLLTSPEELPVALKEHWPLADELRSAVRRGDYEVMFVDDIGRELLESIRE
jgi:hypothetical protein